MIRVFIVFFICLSVSSSFAQKDSICCYFDKNWNETSNMNEAAYFRVGKCKKKNKCNGLVRDYYKSGKIQMRANYENGLKDGKAEYFYESGVKNSQGRYFRGEEEGPWTFYYEDGIIKSQGAYEEGIRASRWEEFYNNGNKQFEGNYLRGKRDGYWVFYYTNGRREKEGKYIDGHEDGIWKFYHENGQLETEGKISMGVHTGIWKYYDENGILKEEGQRERGGRTGVWKYYFLNGALMEEIDHKKDSAGTTFEVLLTAKDSLGVTMVENGNGKYERFNKHWKSFERGEYKNGLKNGNWKAFSSASKSGYDEFYNNGKFVKGVSWDDEGNEYTYSVFAIPAEFPGGMQELMKFLSRNIKYPEGSASHGIMGKVFVEFIVDQDGNVQDVDIKRSVYYDLDAEAIRVVKLMPAWKPAITRGQKVKQRYILPINFKIQ